MPSGYIKWEALIEYHTYLLERGLGNLERKIYKEEQEKKLGGKEEEEREEEKGETGRGVEHGTTGNKIR